MPQATKRAITVEYVVWDGSTAEWPPWLMSAWINVTGPVDVINDYVLIATPEGVMRASLGDSIIQGVEGEIYHCKPSIFAKSYESHSPMKRFTLLTGRIVRATEGSCGMDLFYAGKSAYTLKPGKRAKFATGVTAEFDFKLQVIFKEKSGLADDHGLEVKAGVIEGDYSKEWLVLLKNGGDEDILIKPGMAICQAIIVEKPTVEFVAAPGAVIELKNDKRTGGFGSTNRDLAAESKVTPAQAVGVEKVSRTK